MTFQQEILTKRQQLGFHPVEPHIRRLFIVSYGFQATGKTTFLRSCPPPIGAIDFDKSMEGIAEFDLWGGRIERTTIEIPDLDAAYIAPDKSQALRLMATPGERTLGEASYRQLKLTIEEVLKSGLYRTLAVEGGGFAYGLAQIARFGKLAKFGEVEAQMWRSMQQEFERMFSIAHDYHVNLIVTHRRKRPFKPGDNEIDGYPGLSDFAAHVQIRHEKDNAGNLKIVIDKCRQRKALADPTNPQHEFPIVILGEDVVNESFGGRFVDIATAVFPNTTSLDWGLPE